MATAEDEKAREPDPKSSEEAQAVVRFQNRHRKTFETQHADMVLQLPRPQPGVMEMPPEPFHINGLEMFGEVPVRTRPVPAAGDTGDAAYDAYKQTWEVYWRRCQPWLAEVDTANEQGQTPPPPPDGAPMVFPGGRPEDERSAVVGSMENYHQEWQDDPEDPTKKSGTFGEVSYVRRIDSSERPSDRKFVIKRMDKEEMRRGQETSFPTYFKNVARRYAKVRFEVEFHARKYHLNGDGKHLFKHAESKYFLQLYRGKNSDQGANFAMRHSVFEDDKTVILVMTRCTGEDLNVAFMKYITGKGKKRFMRGPAVSRNPRVMRLLHELFFALALLEDMNVAHLDLKVDNIMLSKPIEEGGNVVLIDMGLARYLDPAAPWKKAVRMRTGTLAYKAPEQGDDAIRRELLLVTHVSDVYAMGNVLKVLLSIKWNPQFNVLAFDGDEPFDYARLENKELADTLQRMTDLVPWKRPTAKELLSRNFLKLWPVVTTDAHLRDHRLPDFGDGEAYKYKTPKKVGKDHAKDLGKFGDFDHRSGPGRWSGDTSERHSDRGRYGRVPRDMTEQQYMRHLRRERRELERERAELQAKVAAARYRVGAASDILDELGL